jgi:hypothetical protein
MTVYNLFAQGDCAYILSDTAMTAESGELIRETPKIQQFPNARLAVGWTGFAAMPNGKIVDRIAEKLAALGIKSDHPSQDNILAALPGVLRNLHAENLAWLAGDDLLDDRAAISLVVAYYRESDASPVLMLGATEPAGPIAAYELFRIRQSMGTDGGGVENFFRETFGGVPNMSDPRQFDARRDGLALLELQRRIPPQPWHFGHYGIGGKAMLTTIGPNGIRAQILKRWPDKIGKPIRP